MVDGLDPHPAHASASKRKPEHIPQDYHLHTRFSVDGKLSLDELCRRMIALGIPEICTTDHADFVWEDPDRDHFRPDDYFAALERWRPVFADRLTIRAGVEIGEAHRFPEEVDRLLRGRPFDLVIGSLHWVGSELILDRRYYEEKTPEQAYGAYFDELLALARNGDFDILGHLDVPKRYNFELYGPFNPHAFEERIRAVLGALIERGKGIEINTGSARRGEGVPSPDLTVLGWYRAMGGEILTIGSDGHREQHVGFALDQAVAMAKAAGFTHLTTFNRRSPSPIPLG